MKNGAEESRTPDPHVANVVLYQLSYRPVEKRGYIHATPPMGKEFDGAGLARRSVEGCTLSKERSDASKG